MKNSISLITVAAVLCFSTSCKKDEIKPVAPEAKVAQADTATLYVLIDSKPCSPPQEQYSSASVDIRGIQIFSAEHGWQSLTPVQGAWDVVSLQTAPVPVAEITENTKVFAGTVTKIKLTIGDNNKLVVNDQAADCYKIGTKEIMIDLQADIKANALNEIVLSIDICGKFTVTLRYDDDPCYTLDPAFGFQSIVQR